MPENAGKCYYFEANIWKLFQPVSMKYVRVQDNHSYNPYTILYNLLKFDILTITSL